MKINTPILIPLLAAFCGSGNFVYGEPTHDLGFFRSTPIPAEHLEKWLNYADQAKEKAALLSKDSPIFSQGTVSFSPEKSLEFEEGKLIALKYYMAFKVKVASAPDGKAIDNEERDGHSQTAIRYDLVTKEWSLVENPMVIQKSKSVADKNHIEK